MHCENKTVVRKMGDPFLGTSFESVFKGFSFVLGPIKSSTIHGWGLGRSAYLSHCLACLEGVLRENQKRRRKSQEGGFVRGIKAVLVNQLDPITKKVFLLGVWLS